MLERADPLLTLALLLAAGFALGTLARRLRLPGITGQIVAGFALAHLGFGLDEVLGTESLRPLTDFALALIGTTVGAHLNLRRLRNAGRRLGMLAAVECAVVPSVVAAALILLTQLPWAAVALLATISLSTAPATVVSIVRETRSRGVLSKTLLGAVAANNITCILLFETAHSLTRFGAEPGSREALAQFSLLGALLLPLAKVAGAIALGATAGALTHWVTARPMEPGRLASISAVALLMTYGLAEYLDLSELLAAMALGVVQTNLNPVRERLVDSAFANFEPVIYCAFFTLAGARLEFDQAAVAGLAAVVFFCARVLGKIVSARIAMRLADATPRVRNNLGLALLPQAGVAIGLVLLVEGDPAFAQFAPLFVAIVLTAVTLSEILGPVAARIALERAGETDRDRPRLVDFLQEENILTDLRAQSMQEAIEEMSAFLVSSHHLSDVDARSIAQSAIERERLSSTCVGAGLAVPHAELPDGHRMVGVMAISRDGLAFPSPDGLPIHCIVLLATPADERGRHLAVLATLARTIGFDSELQEQIYKADSAAHVYELLHGERSDDFNYFLDAD